MARKKTTVTNDSNVGSGKDLDFVKLANAVGGEILDRMDTVKFWIDSGNLALNYGCSGKYLGGGIPAGKIIEVWGNSSSCKTLFALNFVRGVQRMKGIPVFIDVENTLNSKFAESAAHVDTSGVVVIPVGKVDSLEKAFNHVNLVLREIEKAYGSDRPVVIVYDSIAASASEREYAETTLDMFTATKEAKKKAGAGADKPGEHAKIIGKELRKLNPVLNKVNASIVIINQVRESIGGYGNPEKRASGGRALEFYCSLSLKTKASAKLFDDRENVKGIKVSVENTKNKCFRPMIKSPEDAQLLFDVGINPLGGLLSCLFKDYRVDRALKEDGKEKAGWWTVRPEYTNGEEVQFQASLEKNLVPAEILIKCPKLIDAETPEQVQTYLDSFKSTSNVEYTETALKEGDELDEILTA